MTRQRTLACATMHMHMPKHVCAVAPALGLC